MQRLGAITLLHFVNLGVFLLALYEPSAVAEIAPEKRSLEDYYVDLNDMVNLPWDDLKKTLDIGENSLGPAYGSTIVIEHFLTKQGPNSNRPIPDNVILHTILNSYITRSNQRYMTRWYQQDGNTEIFRMFPGDDNVRNKRADAPRVESFSPISWKRGDGWYEWSGRYTFLKVRPGAVMQIKHNWMLWSMQLVIDENKDGTFDLMYIKLRDPGAKTILATDVVGREGYDVKVLDDGTNHKVFVNGELLVENSMENRRDQDENQARWGIYSPGNAIDRDILILVTGVYVGKALDIEEDS